MGAALLLQVSGLPGLVRVLEKVFPVWACRVAGSPAAAPLPAPVRCQLLALFCASLLLSSGIASQLTSPAPSLIDPFLGSPFPAGRLHSALAAFFGAALTVFETAARSPSPLLCLSVPLLVYLSRCPALLAHPDFPSMDFASLLKRLDAADLALLLFDLDTEEGRKRCYAFFNARLPEASPPQPFPLA